MLLCSVPFVAYETCLFSSNGGKTLEDNETSLFHRIIEQNSVDCQQLKRTGARSAGHSAACDNFILTACVCNMRTSGGPGTFIWMWAKRGGHGPHGEDLGGVWQRVEHDQHARKDNPSSSTTAALGPARARGENSKPGPKIRPKVNGGLTTGACWAPRRFTGTRELLHSTLDPLLGAYVGLEGEHVRGGSTPDRQWADESERGPCDRSVLSPTGSSPG
jgi:hypothetical protein